ncbi:hypothetical protein C1X59_03180 [Pseudomonas sp. FW215-R2]|uniref:DUF6124 family protein n=1 Tax=unclassified Pseudomonas TaxID=196821 RepID=UPI000C880127|nr:MULTISPECIES: hypothetical protein [unclassified Pseudomonas]PMX03393.1 hypothetical protein C1X59_03180 [Pseudomonas sp. FW215-R2]PMX12791.1 hypothetical protein C1X60_00265 [Pseudomonas sp. FW215-L1]PMX25049.1 hypothetical protein C1X57_05160 [Pseudomonas sp. FW215-E1]PNA29295.1 hypothetical protein C1X58_14815 [Pseudomonas sp. FW215-R4]
MKKDTPNSVESPTITDRSDTAVRTDNTSRRSSRLVPVNQIFSVRPDVDLLTLLTHASQNLASLNAIAQDFIHRPDEAQRARAVAMHQLAGLAEMLVDSALSKLGPQYLPAETNQIRCH